MAFKLFEVHYQIKWDRILYIMYKHNDIICAGEVPFQS